MPDPLAEILRLVADGRLSAAEAAPLVAALEERDRDRASGMSRPAEQAPAGDRREGATRSVRLEVNEGGRTVVNLRLPAGLGEAALLRVPGMTDTYVGRIKAALAAGERGPVLEVADEDGDGVRIVID
ncbi:MAG TPA: hypothetical protein VEG29_01915 [Candidatus Binatia bacterium]|nr:hypothetical protein [Candidatus Binatia bacterium]